MPGWWPDGFYLLLHLPGVGSFRAPARYTLLTALGLVLFAGPGTRPGPVGRTAAVLGRAGAGGRVRGTGLGLVDPAGAGGGVPGGDGGRYDRRAIRRDGLAWALGLAAIVAWRRGRVGAWAPVALAGLELGVLFFAGPTWWCWEVRLSESSTVLRRLAEDGRDGPGRRPAAQRPGASPA